MKDEKFMYGTLIEKLKTIFVIKVVDVTLLRSEYNLRTRRIRL